MYSWEFNSKKEKSGSWYITAIVVAIWLIIWWYFSELYIMSIVIIMVVWVYFLVENNSPDIIEIKIDSNWILISDAFYDYPKIESFAIIYDKNIPLFLRLRLNVRWIKLVDVPLDTGLNTGELRNFLLWYIEEDTKSEMSTSDRIINYLKL